MRLRDSVGKGGRGEVTRGLRGRSEAVRLQESIGEGGRGEVTRGLRGGTRIIL